MKIIANIGTLLRRQTSGGRYIPELDGLRFIAIFLVLVQHLSERLLKHGPDNLTAAFRDSELAFWASRGTAGVFLFFTISGFIIGLPLLQKAEAGQSFVGLKSYFLRRLTRLEPPYIIWMSVFACLLWLRGDAATMDVFTHWLASIFYVHNGIFGTYSTINPVAWSLEVEIQFYLLAPVLAYFFFTFVKKGQPMLLLLTILLLFVGQKSLGMDTMPFKASILNTIQYFLLGFLLAHLYRLGWVTTKINKRYIWDGIGLLALGGLYVFWSEDLAKEFLFVLSIGLLFLAAFRSRWFRAFLAHPLISTIGGMCYTIYLVHLPLMEALTPWTSRWLVIDHYGIYLLVQLIIWLPLILVFSALAFLAFERPFMNKNWPLQLGAFFKTLSLKPVRMRKLIRNKALWLSFFFWLPQLGLAQNGAASATEEGNFQLQPLPALIQAAMENSADIKIQDYKMDNRMEQVRLIRKDWMKNLQFAGNLLLNNGLYMDAIETINNNAYSLTNRRNVVYNVGVVFKLPVSTVTSRANLIKIEQNEMQIEKLRKDALRMELKNAITELYEQIRLEQEVLRIRTESLETHKIALELAETYFKQGEGSLDDYTRAISVKARAEEELAQTKNRLLLNIAILEEWCGRKVIIE